MLYDILIRIELENYYKLEKQIFYFFLFDSYDYDFQIYIL